ncbi:GNAT family N-acetyltransferase [Massilia sp. 9096]|uniref:GNAT family N-acetyltransferase n=1 Tax=Massilia sp. 9096 TaxID=1500894 RepID=UPI000A68D930|nr:GNAT family N-acetyltransferase [Massilia sp. 9096]
MTMRTDFSLRAATTADIPALQALIARSGIGLSNGFYTPEQAQAITREVFGVDSQLIEDGTYFAIEADARIVACGGWSKRSTAFGGDQHKSAPDRLLDPALDAARIRAFFVDPGMARQGLGSMLMRHCSAQALAAGFTVLELTATMPGVPLYTAHGFAPVHGVNLSLADGRVAVPLTLMRKTIG